MLKSVMGLGESTDLSRGVAVALEREGGDVADRIHIRVAGAQVPIRLAGSGHIHRATIHVKIFPWG